MQRPNSCRAAEEPESTENPEQVLEHHNWVVPVALNRGGATAGDNRHRLSMTLVASRHWFASNGFTLRSQKSPKISSPDRVPNALNVGRSTVSEMNRAEPSAINTLHPPAPW